MGSFIQYAKDGLISYSFHYVLCDFGILPVTQRHLGTQMRRGDLLGMGSSISAVESILPTRINKDSGEYWSVRKATRRTE